MSRQTSKAFLILFVCVLTAGCKKPITESDLQKISGYWEIDQVILPDGTPKDYKVNETIDHFTVDGTKGLRQKVKPQFKGGYLPAGDAEPFEIVIDDGVAIISYQTPFMKWTEEIVDLTDGRFVVKTADNTEYHYKKAVPFNIK